MSDKEGTKRAFTPNPADRGGDVLASEGGGSSGGGPIDVGSDDAPDSGHPSGDIILVKRSRKKRRDCMRAYMRAYRKRGKTDV